MLPGLTIDQAAAGRSTLLAVIIAVVCGAIVLVPALVLLFRLVLRGRFDPTSTVDATALTPPQVPRSGQTHLLAAVAGATFLIGVGMTVLADPGWARVVGIVCLFTCAISAFSLVTTQPDRQI